VLASLRKVAKSFWLLPHKGAGNGEWTATEYNDEDVWKGRFFMSQTRKIITSVAFMRAAAVCPRFSCISLAERAVMIDVIC
jgi:hypothetical protein